MLILTPVQGIAQQVLLIPRPAQVLYIPFREAKLARVTIGQCESTRAHLSILICIELEASKLTSGPLDVFDHIFSVEEAYSKMQIQLYLLPYESSADLTVSFWLP